MAAGADWTLVPSLVVELDKVYNNVITESESMKQEFLNLSATPIERYELTYKALTSANKDTFLTHYKENSGGYYPFAWKSVPSYIGSGSNITGRWVDGSYSLTPVGNARWALKVVFEKSNT